MRMCLIKQVKPRWPSHGDGGGGSPPTALAFYYTPFGIDSPFKELNLNPMNLRRDCQCSSSATSAKACADANPDEPCASHRQMHMCVRHVITAANRLQALQRRYRRIGGAEVA